jgi:CheY-like chemotaxis protein
MIGIRQGKTIFLIEDDFDIREAFTEVLHDLGYSVECAADGVTALEQLRQQSKPCLILLDLMMPNMNGYQFRNEQLKDPLLADIPVVLLTADGKVDQKAADLGGLEYLRKPVDISHLVETIQRYCD